MDNNSAELELYYEELIKTYKKFKIIWEKSYIEDYNKLKNFTSTKCYFGRGSFPESVNSWEVKTNVLLYDTFIFDIRTFNHIVIKGLPLNLDDENELFRYCYPIDLEVSNFLMELYENGSIKLVDSIAIWNDMVNGDTYKELEKDNKLYSKKSEINEISKKAALFPTDEYNYPMLLHMMNEDIMVSYLTDSSIITREYSYYIKRKLNEYNKTKYKYDIINLLLEYEVPNFACLDFNKINSIRNSSSLSNLRKKIEESMLNINENESIVKDIVQNFRDELWEIALNNISDSYSKVIVESLISNLPGVSAFLSAKNLLKIKNLKNHWGYTILEMKKSKEKIL